MNQSDPDVTHPRDYNEVEWRRHNEESAENRYIMIPKCRVTRNEDWERGTGDGKAKSEAHEA